jgi:hypothetical protein
MYILLNSETIKFQLLKLATDFYQQPSYLVDEKSPLHWGMFFSLCLLLLSERYFIKKLKRKT